MKGLLVRVGIDLTSGGWNAPVDPDTLDFAYVPIPDGRQHARLATPYARLGAALARFPEAVLPTALAREAMHLDPDFDHLTYGDDGLRRGRGIAALAPGDFVAFFAGLRPIRPCPHRLLYALIGFYRVRELAWVSAIPRRRWRENAHTRRLRHSPDDVVLRADPSASGRLRRCIPIGEWRDRSYRVRTDLLERWGHLSCRDGYLQRSAVPPSFLQPARFLSWLDAQGPALVASNDGGDRPGGRDGCR
jgi:hypothetical protein